MINIINNLIIIITNNKIIHIYFFIVVNHYCHQHSTRTYWTAFNFPESSESNASSSII